MSLKPANIYLFKVNNNKVRQVPAAVDPRHSKVEDAE